MDSYDLKLELFFSLIVLFLLEIAVQFSNPIFLRFQNFLSSQIDQEENRKNI